MRILVALSGNPYGIHVVREVARLARNTWADVTLLGVTPKQSRSPSDADGGPPSDFAAIMEQFRLDFLEVVKETESPYAAGVEGISWAGRKNGPWDLAYQGPPGKKQLNLCIRTGNPSKAIIGQAGQMESDLIVLGCGKGEGCAWDNEPDAVRSVVNNAPCSVFAVKEEKQPDMIVCCLDNDHVSQASLELINQLVSMHQAELGLVGVTGAEGLKYEVDRKMGQLLSYYAERNIRAWIQLVDASSLESFMGQAAQKDLVALWMGKQSFLDKIFSRQRLSKLIATAKSSVLVLR